VLFPSGRIAYWANGRLNEAAVEDFRRGAGPQVQSADPPVSMTRNSRTVHWFAKWSTELRDASGLPRLLNKRAVSISPSAT
jgi:putative hemolysin